MKLDELRALCAKATPGSWSPFQTTQDRASLLEGIAAMLAKGGDTFVYVRCQERHQDDEETMTIAHVGNGPNGHNNAAFISAARAALPLLLAVAEAAQEAVANDDEWGKFTLGDRYIPPADKIYTEKMRAALAALEAAP